MSAVRATELPKARRSIFRGDVFFDFVMCGEFCGGEEFLAVAALAVVEGEGVAFVALVDGDAEDGGGIEAAGEEDDGVFILHGGECSPGDS